MLWPLYIYDTHIYIGIQNVIAPTDVIMGRGQSHIYPPNIGKSHDLLSFLPRALHPDGPQEGEGYLHRRDKC